MEVASVTVGEGAPCGIHIRAPNVDRFANNSHCHNCALARGVFAASVGGRRLQLGRDEGNSLLARSAG